jgi:hypothetical protein
MLWGGSSCGVKSAACETFRDYTLPETEEIVHPIRTVSCFWKICSFAGTMQIRPERPLWAPKFKLFRQYGRRSISRSSTTG